MAKHPLWNEEYWLLLLQLYQKKPMGVKPLYSKGMVDLSLELHIPPTYLHEQMFKLRMMTPRITRLWEKYANKPGKLSHDIKMLRKMQGYGNAEAFYQGVKLIIILDLYFQLTPITMVAETPEIIDLAKLIHTTPEKIADVMSIYMFCDPYLNREDVLISPLLNDCSAIWQRYGNGNPDKLYQLATELKIYFKKQ